MKKYKLNSNSGFTLIELIVSISLLSIVLLVVFSMVLSGNKMMAISEKEYDFQASERTALQSTSTSIRYSSAVFTIPDSSFDSDNLDEGWDYIGIVDTAGGEEIVRYLYNTVTKAHDATVLVPAQPDVAYQFIFNKINPSNDNNLLQFTIQTIPAGSTDEYGRAKATLSVTSEVSALNSLQVIDLSTPLDPAVAIAFKPDDRTKTVVGHVAMVMDNSGSMADALNGNPVGYGGQSRLSILQDKAEALINKFALEDNIDISLIPFATSANTSSDHSHTFRNAKTATAALIDEIDDFNADGGTNTGDGLRRAYYALNTHNAAAVASGYTPSNYLIILVDGVTTFYSVVSNANRSFYIADGNVNDSGYLDRSQNEFKAASQIAGNGSSLDAQGTAYVNTVGAWFKNASFAKVYVIGFTSKSSELNSVNDIANACSTTSQVFTASSADALETVFTQIQQDIVQDLWYLQGPHL